MEFLFNYQTQSHDSDSLELLHLLWSRRDTSTAKSIIIPEITCGRKVIVCWCESPEPWRNKNKSLGRRRKVVCLSVWINGLWLFIFTRCRIRPCTNVIEWMKVEESHRNGIVGEWFFASWYPLFQLIYRHDFIWICNPAPSSSTSFSNAGSRGHINNP